MNDARVTSWRYRTYESIPQDQPMTRAVWLTAYWHDQERKAGLPANKRATAPALVARALGRIAGEDFALTPPILGRAAAN